MTWFKVDDSFHSHPKVLATSPAALGLWVVAGSWSAANLTDGFVPDHVLQRLLPGATELAAELVSAGLWRRAKGGHRFHDWDDYQPTREEATATKTRKSSGGKLGNHRRWHVGRGVRDPRCQWCAATPADRTPIGYANRSEGGTDGGSDAYPMGGPIASDSGSSAVRGEKNGVSHSSNGQVSPSGPSDIRSDTDRSCESDPNPPSRPDPTRITRGSVDRHPADRYARGTDDEDDLDKLNEHIEGRIIELLRETTGRTVDRAHAAKVRRLILDGRETRNPLGYVASAIRGEPTRFLPPADPHGEAGAQVIAAVHGADWDRTAATAHSGAEQARRLLAARRTAREAP